VKPLSQYQYATLLAVSHNKIRVCDLRKLRDITIWSLAKRGLVKKAGADLDDLINVTDEGQELLQGYSMHNVPYRTLENDITDRLSRLLRVTRFKAATAGR
jgi:hypothetical protein